MSLQGKQASEKDPDFWSTQLYQLYFVKVSVHIKQKS